MLMVIFREICELHSITNYNLFSEAKLIDLTKNKSLKISIYIPLNMAIKDIYLYTTQHGNKRVNEKYQCPKEK